MMLEVTIYDILIVFIICSTIQICTFKKQIINYINRKYESRQSIQPDQPNQQLSMIQSRPQTSIENSIQESQIIQPRIQSRPQLSMGNSIQKSQIIQSRIQSMPQYLSNHTHNINDDIDNDEEEKEDIGIVLSYKHVIESLQFQIKDLINQNNQAAKNAIEYEDKIVKLNDEIKNLNTIITNQSNEIDRLLSINNNTESINN